MNISTNETYFENFIPEVGEERKNELEEKINAIYDEDYINFNHLTNEEEDEYRGELDLTLYQTNANVDLVEIIRDLLDEIFVENNSDSIVIFEEKEAFLPLYNDDKKEKEKSNFNYFINGNT